MSDLRVLKLARTLMGLYLFACDDSKSGKKAVNAETLIPVFIILSVWLRTSFVTVFEHIYENNTN